MKAFPPLALVLSLASWLFISITAINLLSGAMEDRTCQTDCVQMYFFSAVGAGVAALVLSLLALMRNNESSLAWLALLFSIPLCGIVATLFVIGNM